MDKLKKLLEQRGLKATYQRLKILEYLSDHMNSHPTADTIYEALVDKIPTMSVTTIYNNLNAFLEKGLISAETITGTEVRYDFSAQPHHHFLCRKCGRIIDIDIKCPIIERKKRIISGHRIEEVHGYMKGLCKECHEKERSTNKQDRNS